MLNLSSRLDPGRLWSRGESGIAIGDDTIDDSGESSGARKPVVGLGRGLLVVWSQGAARVIRRARGVLLPGSERPAPATAGAAAAAVPLDPVAVAGLEGLTPEDLAVLEEAMGPRA